MAEFQYTEENIRSLDWKEHIRLRPGMYIGKLGDGTAPDDGIYVLLKEIIDNSGILKEKREKFGRQEIWLFVIALLNHCIRHL